MILNTERKKIHQLYLEYTITGLAAQPLHTGAHSVNSSSRSSILPDCCSAWRARSQKQKLSIWSLCVSSARKICIHSSGWILGCWVSDTFNILHITSSSSVCLPLWASQPGFCVLALLFCYSAFQTLIQVTHLLHIFTSSWPAGDNHPSVILW